MSAWRGLWGSERGGGDSGGGEVVIDRTHRVPELSEFSLDYVGTELLPQVTLAWGLPEGDSEEIRIYRGNREIPSHDLPQPYVTLPASEVEFLDDDLVSGFIHYRVASVSDGVVRLTEDVSAEVLVRNPGPFASLEIGDEFDGGYYSGIYEYPDGRIYHLIVAPEEFSDTSVQWKVENTETDPRITSNTRLGRYDGLINTEILLSVDPNAEEHPVLNSVISAREEDSGWYFPSVEEGQAAFSQLYGANSDLNYLLDQTQSSTESTNSERAGWFSSTSSLFSNKTILRRFTPIKRHLSDVSEGSVKTWARFQEYIEPVIDLPNSYYQENV